MGPGLYIHFPWCVRKCPYCAFFSQVPQAAAVAAWHAGLTRELDDLPPGFAPRSLFFGGGTPTALGPDDMARLLDAIHDRVNMAQVQEWTCEVNPGTLTPAMASLLQARGVTRLSIGAQSFTDSPLRRLGRIHQAAATRECVALARAAGFEHIGLDLMYGIPGVATNDFMADVEAALALRPEHVSAYALEIEDGTPWAHEAAAGRLAVVAEDQRDQFDWLRQRLPAAGLAHYELSNFARPGAECRHNWLYWSGGDYIGLGPAAHSHWQGERWGHTNTLPNWQREFTEQLESAAKARETLVMGLRRLAGWGRADFRATTGFDYDDLRGAEIARLGREGLLVVTPERIRLDADALFISDTVFAELV